MTIHYIIQCTSEKSLPPDTDLSWSEDTLSNEWISRWESSKITKPVSELYTGITFKKSLEAIYASEGEWAVWVASAGGGLLRGPSSSGQSEDRAPGYEAFCLPSGPMNPNQMRTLWEGIDEISYNKSGGNCWERLSATDGDTVVITLPTSYQSAVLPSLDSYITSEVDLLGIGSCQTDSKKMRQIGNHPRIREVLGCGFSMLRTTLLQKWIEGGDSEIEHLVSLAAALREPPIRQKITDSDLRALILEAKPSITSSQIRTIRWIRDECGVAASEERIKSTLLEVLGK